MTAIVAREIQDSMRSRWFLAMTGVFCALALGVSYLSFAGANSLGFAGFNRTVASLLNLMVLFVPLMGLLIGALGLSGEREDGTLGYLLAQPVGRFSVYAGKFLGQGLSLVLAVGLGLGLAGLVVGWNAGPAGASAFGMLALVAALLGAASLGVGFLVSVRSATRMRALAYALVTWVVFEFALDALSVGMVTAGWLGPQGLLFVSFANPVQLAKILCLMSLSAKLEVLGPSGIYAVKTFGYAGSMLMLGGGLALWALIPAGLGWLTFRKMNVR
ncbi:MAG TPA: ABC transporter permease subunit [Planctomycetota bacterium]|nr:ABC transporter permease subunit [Planctomycetota bacterium]